MDFLCLTFLSGFACGCATEQCITMYDEIQTQRIARASRAADNPHPPASAPAAIASAPAAPQQCKIHSPMPTYPPANPAATLEEKSKK